MTRIGRGQAVPHLLNGAARLIGLGSASRAKQKHESGPLARRDQLANTLAEYPPAPLVVVDERGGMHREIGRAIRSSEAE